MKILLSTITYYPTIGGADDFARSIAEGLAARGHEVAVATSDLLQHVSGKKLSNTKKTNLNGVEIIRSKSFNLPGHCYPFWPGLRRIIRRFKPDIVHAFNFGYFSVDGAAFLSQKFPLIISPTGGRYRSGGMYDALKKVFERRVLRANIWTALSESERKSLRAEFPSAPRIEILSPSILPEEWKKISDDPFPDIPKNLRILFAGRLSRDKGIDDLIEAMQKVNKKIDAELIVAGPNYGYEVGKIEDKHIHFLGALDREKLVAVFKHSDLVVLPSYHEGFGIVLIEAMAAGKPVIAYDNSSMPELARDGENGFCVKTGDTEALADAIMKLNDPLLRESYGNKGKEIVFREFNRQKMIDKVLELYLTALALK